MQLDMVFVLPKVELPLESYSPVRRQQVTTLGCTVAGSLSTTTLDTLRLIPSLAEAKSNPHKLVVAHHNPWLLTSDS